MGKGTNTTSTSTAPNPVAAQDYYSLLSQAQGVAQTPYTPYTGELTAPVNQQQQTGIGTVNQYATAAQPYLQTAAGYAQDAAQPLTQAQIQQYQSPYTQDVVNATQAQFNNQNAQQQQGVLSNAAAQGALGGDRVSVAQGITAGQQQLAQAPVIAGLENQGYQTGLQTAEQQQQNEAQGAYNLSNVGNSIENAGLTGANAQVGAGTLEQQTQQAQDAAAYQQFEQALQYPFATTGWLAGLETGVGSQLGGTSSTTGPAPNYLAQDIGAGVGVGAALLSDKRAKENLKKIGKLFDGQTIYRFNYKGDNTTRIGLVAQDVEEHHPDAVHEVNGLKSVDYDEATKDAIRRLTGGRVQGLATGGSPYGGDGGIPYASGIGWVPTLGITGGGGAPKAPNAPNQQQSGVPSPAQMATNASKIVKGLQQPGNQTQPLNIAPSPFSPDPAGTMEPDMATPEMAGLGDDTAAFASDAAIWNRGGRVPRAYGGLVLPTQNRIGFKHGGVPVRAGLGMASFLPRYRRQGLDTGGVPDDDNVTFSDRFAGLVPDAGPGWAGAISPVSPVAAAYGQENPYANAPSSAPVPLPPNQNVPEPTAGVGNAVSYGVPAQGNFAPAAAPQAAPDAGVTPPLQVTPTAAASPPAGVGTASPPQPMDVYQNTIKHMETGGQKDPYSAMVPSVDPKSGATRYAVGAYGIMDSNVPSWTKDALGRSMTPQEFAADPSAQDAVFRAKFGNYVQKYGPEGAARAWLAGEGGMNNPNVKDTFGTDPISYGRKFANSIVGAPMSGGNANAQLPATATPTQNTDAREIPGVASAQPAQRGFGLLGLLPQDVGMSAMSAGLGMLASRSPFLGEAIGQGGLQGLSTYGQLQQQHIAQSEKQQDLDIKVAQLNQAAKSESDKIAQEAKKENFAETQMTPAQKAEADFRERNLQRENLAPVKIGVDMSTGAEIYGVRDPTAPGGFRRIDASTTAGTPQGTGAPMVPGAPASPAAPSTPTSQEQIPATASPVSGDTPENVKPEVLASIDPNVAQQVKALDEGRMQFPTGFALKSPYWQNMLRLVSQYDPSFDAVNYNARAKTRADFVAGKSAQNITSFNTAIGHLDTLDKSIDGLGNYSVPLLNTMTKEAARQSNPDYAAALSRFQAAKTAVTDELTRAFRGSGGNVHDIMEWSKALDDTSSPQALHAATKQAIELLQSRIESVGDQYNRGMGTTRSPLTLLSPHAQAAVARLSGEAQQPQFSGRTATNPQTGQKLRETADGQWVP